MANFLLVVAAQYVIFLLPVILFIIFMRLRGVRRIEFVVILLCAGVFGFLGILLASHLFYDPRPFVVSGVTPLFAHAADNGFPSDHTTLAAVMAFVALFYSWRIGIAMLFLAVVIGAARVLAHVHSWNDILGGIVVGLLASILAITLGRYVVRRFLLK